MTDQKQKDIDADAAAAAREVTARGNLHTRLYTTQPYALIS